MAFSINNKNRDAWIDFMALDWERASWTEDLTQTIFEFKGKNTANSEYLMRISLRAIGAKIIYVELTEDANDNIIAIDFKTNIPKSFYMEKMRDLVKARDYIVGRVACDCDSDSDSDSDNDSSSDSENPV